MSEKKGLLRVEEQAQYSRSLIIVLQHRNCSCQISWKPNAKLQCNSDKDHDVLAIGRPIHRHETHWYGIC